MGVLSPEVVPESPRGKVAGGLVESSDSASPAKRDRGIRELVARLAKEAGLRLEELDKCSEGDQLGYNRERHIYKRDTLSPGLIESMLRVLEVAAGDLQSNIFLFPDVLSEVNPAPERYGKIYAMTMQTLHDDPCFDPVNDAVMGALARGPFPVVIWISSRPLLPTVPEVFRTGVFAHELRHARQIEHNEELLEAWECYQASLIERQQRLLGWEQPLEIDAELNARKVIQQLHPGGGRLVLDD